MQSYISVVKTTLPSSWREFEVSSFAQTLLGSGAACVSHHLVTSTYEWLGEVISVTEWSLEIKSSSKSRQYIIDKLVKSHPYDVPQIICSQYETSEEYGNWVNSQ